MRRYWIPIVMLLLAATLSSWAWALREVHEMERIVQAAPGPSLVVIRPTPALRDSLTACHRRLDVIADVIDVIEHRRGQEPPRTLDEVRRYRGNAMAPFKAGKPEVSK